MAVLAARVNRLSAIRRATCLMVCTKPLYSNSRRNKKHYGEKSENKFSTWKKKKIRQALCDEDKPTPSTRSLRNLLCRRAKRVKHRAVPPYRSVFLHLKVNLPTAHTHLKIGRLAIEITPLTEEWQRFIAQEEWGDDCRPTPFFAPPGPADLAISLASKPLGTDYTGSPYVELVEGVAWRTQGQRKLLERVGPRRPGLAWSVAFEEQFTRCVAYTDVSFIPQEHTDWLPEMLWQALYNFVVHNALGACIHSCGVIDESGEGYLFIGHSGAGKSTISRLWHARPGVRVLSDERTVVRQEDGIYWLYGTPWFSRARLSQPGAAPLKAIFSLAHGPFNQCTELRPSLSVANLFSCGHPTYHSPSGMENLLSFLEGMAQNIPHYLLSFTPQTEVVDFVRSI